jgi:23S rRNA (adenine2503-C2)-methyltransferase
MIEEFAKKHKLKSFRIKQFNNAYYKQFIESWDELTTWGKDLRDKLKESIEFNRLSLEKQIESKDKSTLKALFKTKDKNHPVESVLMRHRDGRNTVCLSCMSGCPVGCRFCATGQMGFLTNLTAHEIVDQYLHFARILKKDETEVTNVVFMGMGEPLLNLEEVLKSIKILNDSDKIRLGARRITISTVGIIEPLKKLIESDFKGRLAVSLHAPSQKLREKLIPIAKKQRLIDLMDALDLYFEKTNKRITYEYAMIKNINDRSKHARKLADLLEHRMALVNLIPYNPTSNRNFNRANDRQIKEFAQILEQRRIYYTIRHTFGDQIDAACGQLASK